MSSGALQDIVLVMQMVWKKVDNLPYVYKSAFEDLFEEKVRVNWPFFLNRSPTFRWAD